MNYYYQTPSYNLNHQPSITALVGYQPINAVVETPEEQVIQNSISKMTNKLSGDSALLAAESMLSTTLVQSFIAITKDSNGLFSANRIVENIMENYPLDVFADIKNNNETNLLFKILHNELLKVAIEVSSVNGCDYTQVIEYWDKEINSVCKVVYTLLSKI